MAAHFGPGARAIPDRQADLATVRGQAPMRSHFHFAGHGVYDVASPLDSYLKLRSPPHLDLGSLFDNALPLSRVGLATLSAWRNRSKTNGRKS